MTPVEINQIVDAYQFHESAESKERIRQILLATYPNFMKFLTFNKKTFDLDMLSIRCKKHQEIIKQKSLEQDWVDWQAAIEKAKENIKDLNENREILQNHLYEYKNRVYSQYLVMSEIYNQLNATYDHIGNGYLNQMLQSTDQTKYFTVLVEQLDFLIKRYGLVNVQLVTPYHPADGNKVPCIVVSFPAMTVLRTCGKVRLNLSPCKLLITGLSGSTIRIIYDNPFVGVRSHPHIQTSNIPCYGDAGNEAASCMMAGRIHDFCYLIERLLQDPARDSSHDIKSWPCEYLTDIPAQTWIPKQRYTTFQWKGVVLGIESSLLVVCPVTGRAIVKDHDSSVKYLDKYYDPTAFLYAESHDPVLSIDPSVKLTTITNRRTHPALVLTCAYSGIVGQLYIDKGNQPHIDDDIIIMPNGIPVARIIHKTGLLNEPETVGIPAEITQGVVTSVDV